jgi:hypothetical protein
MVACPLASAATSFAVETALSAFLELFFYAFQRIHYFDMGKVGNNGMNDSYCFYCSRRCEARITRDSPVHSTVSSHFPNPKHHSTSQETKTKTKKTQKKINKNLNKIYGS